MNTDPGALRYLTLTYHQILILKQASMLYFVENLNFFKIPASPVNQ